MPYGKQQPEIKKVAPDFKVFIKGSQNWRSYDGKRTVNFNNMIDSVSVDLSIESTPGSASFSIQVPKHFQMNPFIDNFGNVTITSMMEVSIFIKGNLSVDSDLETGIEYPYYQVFWGMINTVTDSYSGGTYSINIQCVDILHWWEIVKVNLSGTFISSNPKLLYQQKLSELSMHGIIYDMTTLTMQNMTFPEETLFKGTPKHFEVQKKEYVENFQELIYEWQERFNDQARALKMFGFKKLIPSHRSTGKELEAESTTLTPSERLKKERQKKEKISNTSKRNDYIYDVEVDTDEIEKVYPYAITDLGKLPGSSGGESKTKLEIAQDVVSTMHWEFFMDMDGSIVLKPPFYNIDVRNNEFSVIKDIDIISWTRSESESSIKTQCTVKVYLPGHADPEGDYGTALWTDYENFLKFGNRPMELQADKRITNLEQGMIRAQGELNIQNSNATRIDLTIVGRPELKMGYPVYIPSMDCFYYVIGISHSIGTNSSFTTTLQLNAKREKIRDTYQDSQTYGEALKLLCYVDTGAVKIGKFVRFEDMEKLTINTKKNSAGQGTSKETKDFNKLTGKSTAHKNITQSSGIWKKKVMDSQNDITAHIKGFPTESKVEVKEKGKTKTVKSIYWSPSLIQITNEDGYRIFGPFNYGRDLMSSNSGGQVEDIKESVKKGIKILKNAAKAATNMVGKITNPSSSSQPDSVSHKLDINPNNTKVLGTQDKSMQSSFERKGKKVVTMIPGGSK